MNMNSEILQSMGWALVHSLWQSAVLYFLFSVVSKTLGKNSDHHRYLMATATLGMTLIAFCVTVVVLNQSTTASIYSIKSFNVLSSASALTTTTSNFLYSVETVGGWINQNIAWIIRIWVIGSLIGMLRIASGVGYLYFLRKNSLPVAGAWEERVHHLAEGMRINRHVLLAEARVSTPIVIGILKPVILFPIGLMAGLTTAQIEAILIHELTHIRRHDFAVNLFQCMMESVFFFNPFVWIMSAKVRLLREHCCDDAVIMHGVAPLTYVKTLAYVEEISAERMLAPALTGQRYQLLNRMKRIMERSVVKKEWGRLRLLPLWLALVGLVCASWLSIGTEDTLQQNSNGSDTKVLAQADTVVNENSDDNSAGFLYRKDSDGEHDSPPEEIRDDTNPDVSANAAVRALRLNDSIPGFLYTPGGDWERFEKEFTAKFRKEFGDFFEKNREQYEKMMEELRRQHAENEPFMLKDMSLLFPKHLKEWEAFNFPNPPMLKFENFNVPPFPTPDDEKWIKERAWRMEEDARAMSEMFQGHGELFREHENLWKLQEFMYLDNSKAFRDYEDAIVEQLVKDGYLEKGEKIDELQIRNDEITINGKKIKEKDRKKYQEIRDTFEPRWHRPGRVE